MAQILYVTNILIEFGALAQLKAECERVGITRPLIVTDAGVKAAGLLDRTRAALPGLAPEVFDQTPSNPTEAAVRAAVEVYRQGGCDGLIALGGGSAIDCAKGVAIAATHEGPLKTYATIEGGSAKITDRVPPLIAVPTTAGTGSEVTPWATIWDRESQRKYSLHLPQTWPTAAIIDPDLMLSLPPAVTLQSGLDALSHALEAIWNVNANPISDAFAVSAVSDILAVLPRLMAEPGDLGLRGRMALAALKAGMAFSNTKTALAHSISYEMTLRYGLPHGIACSFPLPMVLARAIGQRAERDAVLEQALGAPLAGAPERLARFIEQFGVGTRFGDYGVSDEEAEQMVLHALGGARGKNFIGTAEETLA